ncbi:MAG: ABC transporter permease [Syntrophomonadaceae bacterium]|nr:ABC transporter permease [Syntrophomonadaceae bacterium]
MALIEKQRVNEAVFNKIKQIFTKSAAIILFFAVWELIARLGMVEAFILPPVTAVLKAYGVLISSGELFVHIAVSLQRTATGFFIALIIAIPLGIFMGWFSKLEQFLDPILQMFRNTSVLAMFPVFILVFGLGETSKAAIVFWGSVWPALLSTISGVKNVDPLLIKSANSMGISVIGLFKKVILPAALPEIMTGVRLSAGVATIILVAAEMLGASKGIGFLIFYSEQKYEIPTMYAGIISISVLGVLINFLLVKLESRITYWKERQTAA